MASTIAGYIGKINPGNGTNYSLGSTAYGVCGTAAGTAAKTVEMTGFKLVTGATIFVKFTNANTAASPTLNVQSTGAKPIVLYGTTAAGTTAETSGWQAGAVLCLTYDGTSWVRDQGYNTNTNTDTLVKQTAKTDSAEYKILTTTSASPISGNAAEAGYDANITINPSLHQMKIIHADGRSGEYKVTYGSTVSMWLGIGSGNENHGLYDDKTGKWMISADAAGNVTVNGNATTATDLTTKPVLNVGSTDKQSVTVKAGLKTSDEFIVPFAKHASATHYSTKASSPSGVLKVKIKRKTGWMLSFTLRVYQAYSYQDFVISGYNSGSSHWLHPKAILLGSNLTTKQTVTFGYDDDASKSYSTLWVSIPIDQYTGADIFNVCNGFTQLDNFLDAFEIIHETTSTGIVQTTIDVYRPWYRNETVTTATKATQDSSGNVITSTYLTKAAGVTNVAWNNTNKKLTKTINGSTTDVLQFNAGDGISLTAAAGAVTVSGTTITFKDWTVS